MKRIFVLLCLAIGGFLVLGACQKEEKPKEINETEEEEEVPIWEAGAQINGFAEGQKNGIDFEASASSYFGRPPLDSVIIVNIFTVSEENYVREQIIIGILKWEKEDYTLSESEISHQQNITRCNYDTFIDGGDVLGDKYLLDETFVDNYLKVMEVDTLNAKVRGKFTARFINRDKDSKSDPRNPDIVTFSDVYFESKIPM